MITALAGDGALLIIDALERRARPDPAPGYLLHFSASNSRVVVTRWTGLFRRGAICRKSPTRFPPICTGLGYAST